MSGLYNNEDQGQGDTDFLSMGTLTPKRLMPFRLSTYAQISKAFNPIFTASLGMVYTPSDDLVFVLPTLSISLAPNWELDVLSQSFLNLRTDRSVGNYLYGRFRWSF